MSGLYGTPVIAPAELKTVILTDSDGNEITGVVTGEEVIFDATVNDVREGKTFAGDEGVQVGEKNIPAYHTYEGYRIVTKNSQFTIPNIDSKIDSYDYTKLQAIICLYNTSLSDSVSAEKISINNSVYNVQSVDAISTVNKNHDAKYIDFGIVNELDTSYIIRFFMYKEIE